MCDRLDVERFILEAESRPAIWDMSSKLYADDRDAKKNTMDGAGIDILR